MRNYDLEEIEFKNEKKFLSNMFPSSIKFDTLGQFTHLHGIKTTGLVYPSSEHLYQALKCKSINWHLKLLENKRPESTKTAARKMLKTLIADDIKTFLIRDDFHDIKIDIMKMVVYLKFKQNPDFAKQLIDMVNNGYKVEERNCCNDTFWGTVKGYGKNNLGKILMEVKDIIETENKIQFNKIKEDKILENEINQAFPDL